MKKNKSRKRNYMSKEQFLSLEEGDRVVIHYMLGDAKVAGKHSEGKLGTELPVYFSSGPWEGRTLNLVRQQFKP